MFSDPNLIGKLASNPRTSKHLSDSAFVRKLQMIQQNPNLVDMSDPRMIDVLGALMGIDMQGFSRPEAEDVEMEEVIDDDDAKAKKEAEDLKKAGSEAYKKREFDQAAKCFQKAWDVYPKDITFLTNLGAVFFEQGNYDQAIETCEKAVEEDTRRLQAYCESLRSCGLLIPKEG
ncbi:hypothetical protein GYMLUDRAFT_367460 [Collybiopsis luxurians FD-317 M1]|nr:hypothetical protein GYMLUDRAFT_367460 [Collybiopsis luxurians FD-317 M1]